jgi:uncharacterized protein (TIGR03437 family)
MPAPLHWVQDRQINIFVPWSLIPGPPADVCVTYKGAQTNCLTLSTANTSPGVATVDGNHAAALNQDGTINSAANPAPRNSVVTIWAAGLGPIAPAQQDGAVVLPPLPSNTLFAYIQFLTINSFPGGGTAINPEMLYAGPAPLLVSGVTQINFRATGQSGGAYYGVVGSKLSQAFQIY